MPKGSETTTKFKVDISELKAGMQEAKRSIALANSEFKASTAGMDNWGKSADGLSAKVKQLDSTLSSQKAILSTLEKQHALVAKEQGENSKGAQDLMIKINNQKAAIGKTESELKNYQTKLNDVKTASSNMADETNDSRTSLDKLKDSISEQDSQLAKLKNAYANVVLEQGKNSAEAKDLAREIQNLSGELNDNKSKLSGAESEAGKLDDTLDDLDSSSEEARGGFTVLKGALADLVADGIRSVIDGFKELLTASDEAMADFQAKTGASTQEVSKFKEEIEDLYKQNYGESISDIAESMAEVKQQTGEIDPSKLKDLTKNAIALRDTFGFDIQESMRAVKMLMDQFGVSGEEAFNLIVQGAQDGLNKNGDLLDSINEYGVHYKQLGYSSEEFFNSLKNGTSAGTFSVDKLGDAMKEFGIRTKDTASSTVEGFQLLGYAASASEVDIAKTKDEIAKLEKNLQYATMEQGNFNSKTSELTRQKNADKIQEYSEKLQEAKKSLTDMTQAGSGSVKSVSDMQTAFAAGGDTAKQAISEVLERLYDMDDKVVQNQAGVALFGTMWEDLGIDGVKALMDVQGETDSTKASMAELNSVKYSDVGNQFKEIGRSLQVDLLLPIADAVIPAIKDLANEIKNRLPEIKEAFKSAIEGVEEFVSFVLNNKDAVILAIAAIVAGFTAFKIGSIMSAASGAIIKFATSLKTANFSFKALNATMKANVIILIISIIAGLVAAFITLWNTSEEFRNFWINLWETVKSAFMTAFNAIVNFFTVTIPTTFNNFITFLGGIVNSIVNFFTVTIPMAFTNAVTAVGNFITSVINFFISLPGKIATFLGNVITNVATWASNMVTKAVEMGTNFVNNIMQFFSNLPYKIGFALGTVIGKVIEFGKKLINFAKTEIPKFVSSVVQFISQLPGKFWTWLTSTISKVIAWGSELVSTGRQKASDFINSVINFIRDLPGRVWEWLKSTVSKVVTWGSDMISTGKEKASSFLTTVINKVKALPDKIWNAIKGAIDKVIEWGSNLITEGKKAATDLFNTVVDNLKELPSRMLQLGKDIVNGIWEGIVSAKDWIVGKIKEFMSGLVGGAKEEIKSSSPSKVFRDEVGKNIAWGIAVGIDQNAKMAYSSVRNMAQGTIKSACDEFGIASPSRVFKDKVGKQIVKGLQIGIAKNASSAINTMSDLCKRMLNSALRANGNYKTAGSNAVKNFEDGFKQMMSTSSTNIENAVNAYVKKHNDKLDKNMQERIEKRKSEVEAQNKDLKKQIKKNNKEQINEQINANKKALDKEVKQIKDDTKKKKEEYAKAGKSVINAYSSAMEKAAEKVKNALSNKLNKIAEETQAKYDEIAKMEEDFRTKLGDYGELFTRDEDGNMIINDINKDIDTLKTYGTNLTDLKGKISEELMQEIAGMNVEDAVEFTAGLLQMSEKELQEYNNAYTQKLATAKQISKAFYAEKMAEIKAEYTDKVNKAFANVKKDLQNAGKNAIDGFMNGMTKQAKKADKQVKKIANNIVKQFKKSLKIHSPSRVFEELGVFSGVGYLNGFKGSMANFKNTIADSVRKQALSTKVASGKSGVQQVTYNFYQTNNSPKSLNRLDIYRQTKNQLNFARGV